MSTLAAVSEQLITANTLLGYTADGVRNTEKGVDKLADAFQKYFPDARKDDQEEEIEEDAAKARLQQTSSISGGARPSDSGPGLLSMAGITGLGLSALPFLMRFLRGGFLVAFADELADGITRALGAEEFKDELERGILGLGLASMFTNSLRKAGLVGIIAAIIDKETFDAIAVEAGEIGKTLKENFGVDTKELLQKIRTGLVDGVKGINALLTGDFDKIFGDGTEANPGVLMETLLLVGGLATVFAPSAAFRGAIIAAKAPFLVGGMAMKAIKSIGALGAALGLFGASVPTAAAATTTATAATTAAKGGAMAAILPKMLAFLSGPVGLAILGITAVAGLGYFATKAFQQTDMYKDLKQKSDDIEDKLGTETGAEASLDETANFYMTPTKAQRIESKLERAVKGTTAGMTFSDGLASLSLGEGAKSERLKDMEKQSKIEAEKALRAFNRYQAPPIVDNSTQTTVVNQGDNNSIGAGSGNVTDTADQVRGAHNYGGNTAI